MFTIISNIVLEVSAKLMNSLKITYVLSYKKFKCCQKKLDLVFLQHSGLTWRPMSGELEILSNGNGKSSLGWQLSEGDVLITKLL